MRAWLVLLAACGPSLAPATYPPARHDTAVERGVADPYRWLEAMDSAETVAWVRAENKLADSYFAKTPGREKLRRRIAEMFHTESTYVPQRRGGRVFFSHRDGERDMPTIEVASSFDAPSTTLVDPNLISPDGKESFAGWSPAYDGSRLAYGMAQGGGDWTRWRIRDVATGRDLPEELQHTKYYEPAFTRDATGIYYSRFPTPPPGKELTETDHDCKVYFHRMGTPVESDVVVLERPDHPTWQFDLTPTRDGKYLVIAIGEGQVFDSSLEQIAVLDLAVANAKPVMLVDQFVADYRFIGNEGTTFYFRTDAGAPKRKIVAVDLAQPPAWRDVIPEGELALETASLVDHQLVVTQLRDVHATATAYDLHGTKLRDLELPGLGSLGAFTGGPDDRDAFYFFTSFINPGTVYRYDVATGASTPWHAPKLRFDPAQLETKQIFFASKDGTKVPMFVTAKKGLVLDGTHPTILTAYGGGGVSMTPDFPAEAVPWLEHGGVFALVNVRGGGEYGEAWHLAGKRRKRQTSLDDFIAAGEALIASKYTSPAHLGTVGVSGGGFLVAAVLMQRPDLFGAVTPVAGVHDLLRFPLFGEGVGWQEDLGYPADAGDFAVLQKISPLHNVRAGTKYPAVFVVTSDHDVRVPPLHSYKLTAALQAAQVASHPIVLRVETDTGHGGSIRISQTIERESDIYAFFARELGLQL